MINVKKLALVELDIRDSHVTKVSDLNLSHLKRIYVNKFVQNIAHLAKAPHLEEVYLPKSYNNKRQLRQIPTGVKIIRY